MPAARMAALLASIAGALFAPIVGFIAPSQVGILPSIAFLIGVACRLFEIPLPAPPTLLGVGLILAITVGYIVADRVITNRARLSAAAQKTWDEARR